MRPMLATLLASSTLALPLPQRATAAASALVRSFTRREAIIAGGGAAVGFAAGRLSFTLGLTGPCVALDTICKHVCGGT